MRYIKTMKATLQVHMGNAAFGERPATELARILRNIANDVDDHCLQYVGDAVFAIDINGNSVGKLEIIEDDLVITQGDKKLKEMLED